MRFQIEKVGGVGEYLEKVVGDEGEAKKVYEVLGGESGEAKAFLVVRGKEDGEGGVDAKTIEVRTDGNLAKLLREKYESVMGSRYFGRGGIEIVLSGQLGEDEIYDLVRLSYNLTRG